MTKSSNSLMSRRVVSSRSCSSSRSTDAMLHSSLEMDPNYLVCHRHDMTTLQEHLACVPFALKLVFGHTLFLVFSSSSQLFSQLGCCSENNSSLFEYQLPGKLCYTILEIILYFRKRTNFIFLYTQYSQGRCPRRLCFAGETPFEIKDF